MKLTLEEVEEIFDVEHQLKGWEGDNAFQGLVIISKYADDLVQGADHDIIYSESVEKLIDTGMKREDFEQLSRLNWMVEEGEYLACYV